MRSCVSLRRIDIAVLGMYDPSGDEIKAEAQPPRGAGAMPNELRRCSVTGPDRLAVSGAVPQPQLPGGGSSGMSVLVRQSLDGGNFGARIRMARLITEDVLTRRAFWVEKVRKLSGDFGDDSSRLEKELQDELTKLGSASLIDHFRLCGNIPESYGHDSSEEKLYSKYTDSLLCEAFKCLGLRGLVIKERGDTADVEAFADEYSLVADAKAFRLSRTAKNQKDFKVQAMHGWKRGKEFAMVVCPIHQLQQRSSQIYVQASSQNVCVFTYSHLSVLVTYAIRTSAKQGERLLHTVLNTTASMNPSKDAVAYWTIINKAMLGFASEIDRLWADEKQAATESVAAAKEEALTYLASERVRIMRMSHEEALLALVKVHRIERRIEVIKAVADSGIFGIR